MFLSIIIPVYNAENYLTKCVESIITSPLDDYEIILVDDGSEDGSSSLCDFYSKNYNSVKVIHKSNGGVSSARNIGIKAAIGDWLWFIDADDSVSIELSTVKLKRILENHYFSIINCNWYENDNVLFYRADPSCIPYNVWRCLFLRDNVLKNQLSFKENRKYAEDQEFIMRYVLKCGLDNWVVLPQITYYYYVRSGTAMTKPNVKWKQVGDIFKVLVNIFLLSILYKRICKKAVLIRLKQLLKTFCVTIIR